MDDLLSVPDYMAVVPHAQEGIFTLFNVALIPYDKLRVEHLRHYQTLEAIGWGNLLLTGMLTPSSTLGERQEIY